MIKFIDFADPKYHIKPLQIKVEHNFESAFRLFKAEVQKEKVIGLYKANMAFEKPSIKKRRKRKENRERLLQVAMREKMIKSGEWEKRQRLKEDNRRKKMEKRVKDQEKSDDQFF